MGIEIRLGENDGEKMIDKTNPLDMFPDLPKTWDAMSDTQLGFYLKQLARRGETEVNIRKKLEGIGYNEVIVIDNNPKNMSEFTVRIKGHSSPWVQY